MPFIWDDNEWLLIDDDDSYDKNRFVVVHKLHVKLNESPWQILVRITWFYIHFIKSKRKLHLLILTIFTA